jgi:hypothetical protein
MFFSFCFETRSIFKNSRVYFDSNESLPDASSILAAKLLEKIYALSSLVSRGELQLDSSFSKHKILVVSDHQVDRATVKANKANLMNPAREILDDEIFYAGSQHLFFSHFARENFNQEIKVFRKVLKTAIKRQILIN